MKGIFLFCTLVFMVLLTPAYAVDPGERLADPALEERARNLSQELRCLVCQNQSIDGSDAPLAKDLRILVRDRLSAGDSDDEVMAYVVARYGEFVLLRPMFHGRTWLLWVAPFLILLSGAIAVLLTLRRRKSSEIVPISLSEAEKTRLEEIVNNREKL